MIQVQLFTTLGCHLCEDAALLLQAASLELPVEVVSVEISEDQELVERYGIRIPVIRKLADGNELGWPFDLQQLQVFLS